MGKPDSLFGRGLIVFAALSICHALTASPDLTLENDTLRVTLSPADASVTAVDKRAHLTWRQHINPGYKAAADELQVTATSISAEVSGEGETYLITLSLDKTAPQSFNLKVDMPGRRYIGDPGYPFHFVAPDKTWFYVQNTGGEGLLMPLSNSNVILNEFSWSGSQPWYGLTNLSQAMSARLDTFCNPGRARGESHTVYALPMRATYTFLAQDGYNGLAKEFRKFYLNSHPDLQPLTSRVSQRPALSNLKDGVYVYLWGTSPAEDLSVAREMKAAGVDHAVGTFYGRHPVDRALCDGIKELGWTVGTYHMPTGQIGHVSRDHGWVNAYLSGRISAQEVLAQSDPRAWDRICGKYVLPGWIAKAKTLIKDYGFQLFYFDTLVVQLAPCLDPSHPSTIEENESARVALMQQTRDLGTIVGSGEGLCPTWALPGLDFFEGLMSLRPYADNSELHIPAGDYARDLGSSYAENAAVTLDPTRRIPLYELAFHDYVSGTWVWRDSNYQSVPYAHKKDLFNILYGTMPMWHINRQIWEAHKVEFVASYKAASAVRGRIGFAEMLDHRWLSPDREVQATDWSSGDRVIVNFGDRAFDRAGRPSIPPQSFALEKIQ